MRVCSAEGCGGAHYCKGLCQRHYDAAYYQANIERKRATAAVYREANRDVLIARTIAWQKANPEKVQAKNAAWRRANPEKVEGWREVAARYYQAHRDEVSARQSAYAKANPDKRAAHSARRRALKVGNGAEPYDRLVILGRDGWVCQLCQEPIDPALVYPDAASSSIDHVVPISRGGPDTPSNVQAAHLICNVRKGKQESVA